MQRQNDSLAENNNDKNDDLNNLAFDLKDPLVKDTLLKTNNGDISIRDIRVVALLAMTCKAFYEVYSPLINTQGAEILYKSLYQYPGRVKSFAKSNYSLFNIEVTSDKSSKTTSLKEAAAKYDGSHNGNIYYIRGKTQPLDKIFDEISFNQRESFYKDLAKVSDHDEQYWKEVLELRKKTLFDDLRNHHNSRNHPAISGNLPAMY